MMNFKGGKRADKWILEIQKTLRGIVRERYWPWGNDEPNSKSARLFVKGQEVKISDEKNVLAHDIFN